MGERVLANTRDEESTNVVQFPARDDAHAARAQEAASDGDQVRLPGPPIGGLVLPSFELALASIEDRWPKMIALSMRSFVNGEPIPENEDHIVSNAFDGDVKTLSGGASASEPPEATKSDSSTDDVQLLGSAEDPTAQAFSRLNDKAFLEEAVKPETEARESDDPFARGEWDSTVIAGHTSNFDGPSTRTAIWENGTQIASSRVKYLVIGTLGASTFSETYLAYEVATTDLPRPVVVRRLRDRPGVNFETARLRFTHRARTASSLRHPSILGVLDYGDRDGVPFLVREAVDALNIRALLTAASGALPLPVIIEIGCQVAAALEFLHERRDGTGRSLAIVHGEINPLTIMVERDRNVRITEPGASDVAEFNLLEYASPEHVERGRIDERSDVFSLGIVLLEMLTGPVATEGRIDFDGLDALVEARMVLREDIPTGLRHLIRGVLSIDPDLRPGTREVASRLGQILAATGQRPDLAVALIPVFDRASVTETPTTLSIRMSRPRSNSAPPGRPSSNSWAPRPNSWGPQPGPQLAAFPQRPISAPNAQVARPSPHPSMAPARPVSVAPQALVPQAIVPQALTPGQAAMASHAAMVALAPVVADPMQMPLEAAVGGVDAFQSGDIVSYETPTSLGEWYRNTGRWLLITAVFVGITGLTFMVLTYTVP